VVLAALAIASYQTYTVRAQISEGLNFAAGAKTPILAAYAANGVAPANRTAAGMTADAADGSGYYVSQVHIVDGRIDVTFGGPSAHQDIVGRTISLTPYAVPDDSIVWRCGAAMAPAGAPLKGTAGHRGPTVEQRYLPGYCR